MRPGHGRPALTALTIAAFAASGATASAVPLDTSSVTDTTGVRAPSVGLPSTPQVQAPQLPSTPQVPSLPSAPSLPSTPSVPQVGGQLLDSAPSVTESMPVVPSTSSAPAAGEGAGTSGSSSSGGSGSRSEEAPPTRAERRANHFEQEVRELRSCLAVLTARERQFASMRAGVPFGRPMSRGEVARRLGISLRLARQLERSALHSLRAAARADRCGRGEPVGFGPAPLAMKASLETMIATQSAGATSVASSDSDSSRGGGSGSAPGTNVVASVFEQGPGMAGLGGSLLVENPSVSSVAVGFGILLILAAAAHLYRRRLA